MEEFFAAIRSRLTRAFGVGLSQDALPIAALIALAAAALAWWQVGLRRLQFAPPVIVSVAIVGIVIITMRQKWSDHTVARIADDHLHTDDILATSVLLRELPQADSIFVDRIHERAGQVAARHQPNDVVQLKWVWWRWALVAGAIAAIVALFLIEGPAARQRAIQAANKKAIQQRTAAVQKTIESLKAQPLTPETLKTIEELKRLKQKLEATKDPLVAAEVLEASAATIDRTPPAERLSKKAAQKGLERSLKSQPLPDASDTQTASEQLKSTAEAIRSGKANPATTADRLAELADSQRAGNPDVADSLSKAADAARAGDSQGAAAALDQAAAQQDAAASQVADQETQSNTAQSLRDGSQQLQSSEAAKQQGQQQGQQQQGQGKQGQQQGQGQQGQGQQGQQQGQGQGQTTNSGTGGKKAGRGANDSIGAPSGTIARTTGELNVPALVPPSADGATVGTGQASSPSGAARVPLQDAIPQSKQAASKALDKTDLEADERNTVSSYFDSLSAPAPTQAATQAATPAKPKSP